MKARIYHSRTLSVPWKTPHWPEGYELVAEIDDAEGMEDAFERTNHIDADWRENPGVRCLVAEPRSTSVGDVVELDGDGMAHRVASFGWEPVPKAEAEKCPVCQNLGFIDMACPGCPR